MNKLLKNAICSTVCTLLAGMNASAFVHPGLSHTHADLVRIKANALSNNEPWKSEYALFMANTASASYSPSPVVNETIGNGQFEIRRDAGAAADLALKWFITGDSSYKTACTNILNAWSSTMQTFDPADNLSASEAIRGFGDAAEILQYEGGNWAAADVTRFKNMLLNLLYPSVAKAKTDGMTGNQGIDAISAAMGVGIVCDVQQYFNDSVTAWTTHPCCAVQNFILPSGQMGEAGRDQPHSSGELMCADNWALFAWNQGVDLYSASNNRLLAGFEYWAKYNLGNDVPFQQMTNCNYTYSSMSSYDRGRLAYVYFEKVYHHYVTLMGVTPPPYIQQAILRMRPNPWGLGVLRWYSGPATAATQLIPNGTYSIISRLNNRAVSVPNDSTVNSAQLDTEDYSARPSQLWTFTHLGGNIYSVVNQQGKATDIPGLSVDTGVKVQIYTPSSGLHQRWRAVQNPDGTFSFLNANSSWGFTISGGSAAGGVGIVQDYMPATPNSPYHQEWTLGAPSTAVPAAPTGLNAVTQSGRISLSWTSNALTTGYTVKRATASGGPYTTLATGLTLPSYTDSAVTNGTTYFYVVAASNQNGSSANSSEFVMTAGLPSPWQETDLGSVGTAGYTTVTSDYVYTVNGAGGDIGGSADSGHYLYQPLSGDGAMVARVTGASSGKKGIMMRSSLAANAQSVTLMLDGSQVRMATRATVGGGTSWISNVNVSLPQWLKIERIGNTFTGSYSADGITWTTVGSVSISMTSSINSGLVMCSRTSSLGSVSFDNATLPAPWKTQDVGAVGATGNSGLTADIFSVWGSGADTWGTSDAFRYTYQPASGDCEIRARVTSVGNTNPWAKAGIMIRESTGANSAHAYVAVTPSNGIAFQRRLSTGGSSYDTHTTGLYAPYWVRLVRSANTFTAYRSADGANWTLIGSQSITMGANVLIGLAVTSHNDGVICAAKMDSVTVTP